MRNLMLITLMLYFAVWWLTRSLGNSGLWLAIPIFLGSRGLRRRRGFQHSPGGL